MTLFDMYFRHVDGILLTYGGVVAMLVLIILGCWLTKQPSE